MDVGPEGLSITLGSARFYRPRTVLRVFGEDLFAIREPEEPGGPIRLSARFYDERGRLCLRVEDNILFADIGNWDFQVRGPRIIVRSAPRKPVLVIRVRSRSYLELERLEMYFRGVRFAADPHWARVVSPLSHGFQFRGEIRSADCCFEVSRDYLRP
jgi:hypothetical protein